ncbi:MAG: carbamoyltransferase HypF [Bacteroidota bacterium]
MSSTFKIQIKGQVQGVGFRPFVFNLAKKHNIKGSVTNNGEGVLIYCNTNLVKASFFLDEIIQNKPEISIITGHSIDSSPKIDFDDFSIISPSSDLKPKLPLTPDFAVCQECKSEISNKNNRRYNYAFTTCVNCGPRYSITKKYPFERANTSLSQFDMCSECEEEYQDSSNRRFHSQTNSCNDCGIQLKLVSDTGKTVTANQDECILRAAKEILKGNVLAIKNTNGYMLCCLATNSKAIKLLRDRKKRPQKPFAVLYPSLESIKKEYVVSPQEISALKSRVAPIVLLKDVGKSKVCSNVIAPNIDQMGVMLASSALMELIIRNIDEPIVTTSGNIHGSTIIADEREAEERLSSVADFFLHHNLDIQFPQDDSVVKFMENEQLILRRSRGLAPNYLEFENFSNQPILAMGAHLKSTFAFAPNRQTYVSQYFGNLDNYDVLKRYESTIEAYVDLFKTKPESILIDSHQQYQSSILAEDLALKWNSSIKKIQHHKAHFCSVLGENKLFNAHGKILGVVWDGSGLGDDNHIWGGEFFSYEAGKIKRLDHVEYYNWIANDKFSKEPRLSLFSILSEEFNEYAKPKFSSTEWNVYSKMIKSNTTKTSSIGRLFDAVASALDLADMNTFEGEAAILLENCANRYKGSDCIDFTKKDSSTIISPKFILESILNAYHNGLSKERLAFSFIYTLARIIVRFSTKNHIKIITCSGGVFQNATLISILKQMCKKQKIELKLNRKLSPNDENISFGQLMYHLFIKN